jgi:hypothetical protein
MHGHLVSSLVACDQIHPFIIIQIADGSYPLSIEIRSRRSGKPYADWEKTYKQFNKTKLILLTLSWSIPK